MWRCCSNVINDVVSIYRLLSTSLSVYKVVYVHIFVLFVNIIMLYYVLPLGLVSMFPFAPALCPLNFSLSPPLFLLWHSLSPSAGCSWTCWSFCLRSSRLWPRLIVWCWPTCSRLRCRVRVGPKKRTSSSTSKQMSLPRSRQCCRLVLSNINRRNGPKPLIHVLIIFSCKTFVTHV